MIGDFLLRLPCGDVRVGDELRYRRRFDSGWVTARSADALGRWVNGVDRRGRSRSIAVYHITRVTPVKNTRAAEELELVVKQLRWTADYVAAADEFPGYYPELF